MEKSALLTWHYLDNYGSLFQTYALKTALENKGLQIEVINYVKDANTSQIYNVLRYGKTIINSRKRKFSKFRKKYFNMTKLYNQEQLSNTNFLYKQYICGSDQIWSYKRYDKMYYLDFVKKNNICSSYAASTIQDEYNKEQIKEIKNNLKKFKIISVRESKGAEIIQKFTDKTVYEVLDPTMLLDKNDYDKLITTSKRKYENYLLCYLIGDEDKYESIVNRIKEKYKCENIININITKIHRFGKIVSNASPGEFLNLIKNAKVIVTDSYHGTLFAIKYEKEFYSLKRFESSSKDMQNLRITNILSKVDCLDREISCNENNINRKQIDYKNVNKKLTKYINYSNEIIEKITGEEND